MRRRQGSVGMGYDATTALAQRIQGRAAMSSTPGAVGSGPSSRRAGAHVEASQRLYVLFEQIHEHPERFGDLTESPALAAGLAVADGLARREAHLVALDPDDFVSYLHERVLYVLRHLDRSMTPQQMMAWFYPHNRQALKHAERKVDPLSRRPRERVRE